MLINKIKSYVEMHRKMGFKYKIQNSLLLHFASFAKKRKDTYVHSKTVLDWAVLAPSPAQRRNRLLTVRRFAIYMQTEDKRYEIPPADVFGCEEFKKRIYHILTATELKSLLTASLELQPANTIKPITYATLFAILAVTGMRISEALALNIKDITEDGLIISSTKFKKDRLIPLHESTRKGINNYLKYRIKHGYGYAESALFISNHGTRLAYSTVNSTFLQIARSIGLRSGPGKPGVRIHDLRHRFAVISLEQSNGSRADISRQITALSTYLGHAHISDTYWYLHATPTLMKQIATTQQNFYRRKNND